MGRDQRPDRRRRARAPAGARLVYGRFPGTVEATEERSSSTAGASAVLAEPDPADLPWEELGVDVVIEATGRFRTRADAARHLAAGARKVILSAPAKETSRRRELVLGVNFDDAYDPARHHVITNASCTTNCLAPVAKVLHETVGIRHGADDDDPRLHGRPEPARRAAQGPPARARGGAEPRPDVDRARRRRSAS